MLILVTYDVGLNFDDGAKDLEKYQKFVRIMGLEFKILFLNV